MILTKEMEDGFIGYDTSMRNAEERYEKEIYDDVFVHWEKKNMFGKIVRKSKTYSFKRLKTSKNTKYSTFTMTHACEHFIDRLTQLLKEKYGNDDTVEELMKEFSGSDDFSLGVQHAIAFLKEKKII